MTVTAASLLENHPEFTQGFADYPNMVNGMISQAIAMVDESGYGSTALYDKAVEWKACELLAMSPFARDMRLNKDLDKTYYTREYENMAKVAGSAYRVLP